MKQLLLSLFFTALTLAQVDSMRVTWVDPVDTDLDSVRLYGDTSYVWAAPTTYRISVDEGVEVYEWQPPYAGQWVVGLRGVDDSSNVTVALGVTDTVTLWQTFDSTATLTPADFTDLTDVALSSYSTSNGIALSAFDSAYAYAAGDSFKVGNVGALGVDYVRVFPDDTVFVSCVASGVNSTAVVKTLTIGGVDITYSVTTIAAAGYSQATLDYITRVEADGGVVIDTAEVEAVYASSVNMDSALCWIGTKFGVRKSLSNTLFELYDLSNNDNDLTFETDTTLSPTWSATGATFGINDRSDLIDFGSSWVVPNMWTLATARNTYTATRWFMDGGGASSRMAFFTGATNAIYHIGFGSGQAVADVITDETPILFSVVNNTTDTLYANGAFEGAVDAADQPMTGLRLNDDYTGGSSGTVQTFKELVIYATGGEIRTVIEGLINTRWSIY